MKRFYLLVLLLLIIAVAACAPSSALEQAASEQSAPAGCLAATADTELLQHEAFGYCLLFPADYQVRHFEDNVVELAPDLEQAGDNPRVMLKVTPANGRSAAQVADDLYNQIDAALIEEFVITRSTVTIDGMEAHVIDNVPEQGASRYVFVTNGDLLYSFSFTPVGTGDMESFYSDVVNSLRFVPVAANAPLDAGGSRVVRDDS